MRKIKQSSPVHNDLTDRSRLYCHVNHSISIARALTLLGLALLVNNLLGCQGESQPQSSQKKATPETALATTDCHIVISHDGLDAFLDLSQRLARGEDVPLVAFEELLSHSDYDLWVNIANAGPLNPHVMMNVMNYVFTDQTEGVLEKRRSPKRTDLITNFTYLSDHANNLTGMLEKLSAEDTRCRIYDLLRDYMPNELLPNPLHVNLIAMTPEIRYYEGKLLVDAGLAMAAGTGQLTRMLASVLYRDIMKPTGRAPHENLPGDESVVAAYRKLLHEGIASWLEGYPDLLFDSEHPYLGKPQQYRKETQMHAVAALKTINKYLPSLMENENNLYEKGALIDDVMRGSGTYPATGYTMAAMIVQESGEDRLKACAQSPAEFVREYQDAALKIAAREKNPARQPPPPPFVESSFDQLMKLLESHEKGL